MTCHIAILHRENHFKKTFIHNLHQKFHNIDRLFALENVASSQQWMMPFFSGALFISLHGTTMKYAEM